MTTAALPTNVLVRQDVIQLSPAQVIKQMIHCIEQTILHKRPLNFCVWGEPGIGKSTINQQVIAHFRQNGMPDFRHVDIRLSQTDGVELKGVMYPDLKTMVTHTLINDVLPTSGQGLITFGEISRGTNDTISASLQIFVERQLAGWHLPDTWALGADGNYATSGGARRIGDAAEGRLLHLHMRANDEI